MAKKPSNKWLRRILLLSLVFFVLVGVVFFSIGRERYNAFIQQKLIIFAQQANIPLAIEGFHFGYPALRASRVDGTIRTTKIPFGISAENISITPSYLSFLQDVFAVQLAGKFYDGSLTSALTFSPKENTGTIEIEIEKLQLSKHPQIAGFGVESGLLSFRGDKITMNPDSIPVGAIELSIEELNTASEITLLPQVTGLPLPLVIPPLKDAKVDAEVFMKPEHIAISSFTFTSSWGEISGKGDLAPDGNRRIRAFSIAADVSLSAAGRNYFGSFLPLLSGKLTSATSEFTLTVGGFPLKVIAVPKAVHTEAAVSALPPLS